MPKWTEQQMEAIQDRGHSLIVCAAAGSGKTAVLVERIVRLIQEGCSIEQMLIVTFTNAAAGEMRQRIGQALEQVAMDRPELAQQVMALTRASISTLHRFCGNLIREHFQTLGIDPAFRIGDEQECGVLARQAMEDALYACYEVGSEDFMAADACFEQEKLEELAHTLHKFMMTRPDPWKWLEETCGEYAISAGELANSECAHVLLKDAKDVLGQLIADAKENWMRCTVPDGPTHYASACEQDMAMLTDMEASISQGMEAFRNRLGNSNFATLGRKKKGDVFSEEEAEWVKQRRATMKKQVDALRIEFGMSLEDAAADMKLTQAPMRGLAELVRTYDTLYAAAKNRRGVVDFNDLEHMALKALTHEEVCQSLRDQYRYVFVDEYQDSSAIQEAIVGSFAREDGLFLVGDVKQSIYRFRQAEPTLFLTRAERYDREEETQARRIDLQCNFRSRANVLRGVNAVFEQIMRGEETEIEYDAREALIPGLPEREDDPPLEMHVIWRQDEETPQHSDDEESDDENEESERNLVSIEREARIAAGRIKALIGTPFFDAKSGGERPLTYRDMAILMRVVRGSADLVADILQGEGIPVFCDAGEGYFDIPEIRAVMALLTAIDNGAQDEALLASLRGPALGLEEQDLAEIRIFTPDHQVPYYEAVRRYREENEDELAQKLRVFEEKMDRWRLYARHQGVDALIEHIYTETLFLAKVGALPGGAARQANLHLFVSRARAFMDSQGGSLHAFLRYAEHLKAGGDSMSASAIGESEDVVRIMSTHKSKGLEFPVAFVLGMGRKMGSRGYHAPLLLHAKMGAGLTCVDTELGSERETLLRRAIRKVLLKEQLSEEIRILYVAMTRARERLILIGDAGMKTVPKQWEQGRISAIRTGLDMVCPTLMQAGAACMIPEETVQAGKSRWCVYAHQGEEIAEQKSRSEDAVRSLLERLDQIRPDAEQVRLMDFVPQEMHRAVRKTSVSAVLRDQKRMEQEEGVRETEIIRLPRFKQESHMTGAQIGTAFHRMMRMIDLERLKAGQNMQEELLAQRDQMLADGVITQAEYAAVPLRMMTEFFASPIGLRMLRSERVEREWAFTFRRESDGQIQLVQGVIDCCFVERGRWVLIDYKTDSQRDVSQALEMHRPQLTLYAEALKNLTSMDVQERVLYMVRLGVGYAV